MATVKSVMAELKSKGREQTRKTYVRHGMPADRMFGVSIADLKVIAKKIKGEQQLACDLYDTGNVDAMCLAGLVAHGLHMTRKQLETWAKGAVGISMVSAYTVPRVTAESPHARDLAMKWIAAKDEDLAACGWSTYTSIVSATADADLDIPEIAALLSRIVNDIHTERNRVRSAMNNFVIAVGAYVTPLLDLAKASARKIGAVSVDMGNTACQVPLAAASIDKVEAAGRVGRKRTTMRC